MQSSFIVLSSAASFDNWSSGTGSCVNDNGRTRTVLLQVDDSPKLVAVARSWSQTADLRASDLPTPIAAMKNGAARNRQPSDCSLCGGMRVELPFQSNGRWLVLQCQPGATHDEAAVHCRKASTTGLRKQIATVVVSVIQ